jgi:hypothetical protein
MFLRHRPLFILLFLIIFSGFSAIQKCACMHRRLSSLFYSFAYSIFDLPSPSLHHSPPQTCTNKMWIRKSAIADAHMQPCSTCPCYNFPTTACMHFMRIRIGSILKIFPFSLLSTLRAGGQKPLVVCRNVQFYVFYLPYIKQLIPVRPVLHRPLAYALDNKGDVAFHHRKIGKERKCENI